MKKTFKNEIGITLIALVITIIVLLILAAVSIATLTGDNGILKRTQEAKEKTEEATRKERADLDKIDELIGEATSTEKTIEQVTDLKPGELEEDEAGVKVINSIEDLVFFANSVTTGTTYEGNTVKLGLSLDFNSSKSYVDPYRTDYGKYGYDGELKSLLTSGEGFKPIGIATNESGFETKSFSGIFDGNGKVIKNLYINKKVEDNVNDLRIGFFGNNYGEIKKLGLENCNIKAELISENTNTLILGGIAGVCYKSINLCYTSGEINSTVTGNGAAIRTGGITGQCSFNCEKIKNCYNYSNVKASGETDVLMGGIVGFIFADDDDDIKILNCYNIGYLEGEKRRDQGSLILGGIVGHCCCGIVENCYSKNKINIKTSHWSNGGGIIGQIYKEDSDDKICSIKNCHSICEFFGNGETCGQIIGHLIEKNVNIEKCSYLKQADISGVGAIRGVEGSGFDIQIIENESDMPNILNVLGNEFKMGEHGYPILNWQ